MNNFIDIINLDCKKVKDLDISKFLEIEMNEHLVSQVVRYLLALNREGTAFVKRRGAVSISGRKKRAQKRSGSARIGDGASPHWTGGGVAFGPNNRIYKFKINKKQKLLALMMVIADKLKKGNLLVVDNLTMNEIKTKNALSFLKSINALNVLCVGGINANNFGKSVRNIKCASFLSKDGLNVYSILKREKLVLDLETFEFISSKLCSLRGTCNEV